MARDTNYPWNPVPIDEAVDLGLRFLDARRTQNLSWMRVVEQSLRTTADMQRAFGPAGDTFARLASAQAGLVRDSAKVYGLATSHLMR